MKLKFEPFEQIAIARFLTLSHKAFGDYITRPHLMKPEEAQYYFDSDYISNSESFVFSLKGKDAGYALISLDGNLARLASIGIAPEFRGKGIGRYVLEKTITTLSQKQFKEFHLEVFEQNKNALHLYESLGFQRVRRLPGFIKDATSDSKVNSLQEIDTSHAKELCEKFDDLSMPWQTSSWRLAQLGKEVKAWTYKNEAIVVVKLPDGDSVSFVTLIVNPKCRRQGVATKVIESIQSLYPQKKLSIPQLCPEEAQPFFESLNFKVLPLSQIQMKMKL